MTLRLTDWRMVIAMTCKMAALILSALLTLAPATASETGSQAVLKLHQALRPLVGPLDSVVVASPEGATLVAINADRQLVPASILKLITVLAAWERLGEDFRFRTEFYHDRQRNLIIKGFGDPLLISERLATIAATLAVKLPSFQGLVLDDSYFDSDLVIPGTSATEEPYDAPNGALCVNFNTVAFRQKNGGWISDEPQTPLLASVIPKIRASGLRVGRITLAANSAEALEYTGGLFHYFFDRAGLFSKGVVTRGRVQYDKHTLIWRYYSADNLRQVAGSLLKFSNNFIANQILLVMGAETYGPPATIEKGLRVLNRYCGQRLGMLVGRIVEASGISRQNRLSARTMMTALDHFEPHHRLLRQDNRRQFYKTGHLRGVRTRAGYITSRHGGRYRFVVILNTPGKTTHPIMKIIENNLD